MAARGRLKPFLLLVLLFALFRPIGAAIAAEPGAIERDLVVTVQGEEKRVDIDAALALFNVPSVSIALIDEGRIAFARAYGQDATPATLYQAASLSKFVAAIGAMRLVENGTLKLDEDVNETLTSWTMPTNDFDSTHKVTLRGLLSMTGGVGVPGFLGYAVGAPLPTLAQILDGAPPANSPPVTMIAVPGSAYHYSGGGYEIAEALMQDATGKPFPQLMRELVLDPMGMADSSFDQPPNAALMARATSGHFGGGKGMPCRMRIRCAGEGDGPGQPSGRLGAFGTAVMGDDQGCARLQPAVDCPQGPDTFGRPKKVQGEQAGGTVERPGRGRLQVVHRAGGPDQRAVVAGIRRRGEGEECHDGRERDDAAGGEGHGVPFRS